MGLVGRDAWFASLFLICLGSVARAGTLRGRRRAGWLAAGAGFGWLCLGARQNAAAAVVVPVVLAVGLIRGGRSPTPTQGRRSFARSWPTLRRGASTVLAGASITIVMAASVLVLGALSSSPAYPQAVGYAYDLASLSRREHRNLFPHSVLAVGGLRAIRAHSTLDDAIGLFDGPHHPLAWPITAAGDGALAVAWRAAAVDDPLDFLGERIGVFAREISLTHPSFLIYPTTRTSTRTRSATTTGSPRCVARRTATCASSRP